MILVIDFLSHVAHKSIGCEDECPLKWFLVTSLLPESFYYDDPGVSLWGAIQTK